MLHSMFSKQMRIVYLAACLALIGIAYLAFHKPKVERSDAKVVATSKFCPPANSVPEGTPSASNTQAKNTRKSEPRKLLSRKDFLEQICPSLTAAEEERYLAKYGRTAGTLIGLLQVGSPNGMAYLKEALTAFPDDPLVQYSALEWGYPDLDLAACAEVMKRRFPNDSLHRQIMVKKLLVDGDLQRAVEHLKLDAAGQTTTIFSKEIQALKDSVWNQNGRTVEQYSTRSALEAKGLPQMDILTDIASLLGTQSEVNKMSMEAKDSLPYIAYCFQDLVESKEIGIQENAIARVGEREALEKLLAIYGANQPKEMFPVPLEKMIEDSRAEELKVGGLAEFTPQITQIFQRISAVEQSSFVAISNEEGQLKAMEWLLNSNPAVFTDPDFPPEGIPRNVWKNISGQWLKRTTGK